VKYTESSDGQMRATIKIPIRLTQQQLADLRDVAKEDDTDLHSMLSSWLDLAIEGNMADKSSAPRNK
jgi:hypothetical protein